MNHMSSLFAWKKKKTHERGGVERFWPFCPPFFVKSLQDWLSLEEKSNISIFAIEKLSQMSLPCSYYFFIAISYILVFFVISSKIINLLQLSRIFVWLNWAQCYQDTVWKFQDFSVTQILREINFVQEPQNQWPLNYPKNASSF